MDACERRCEQCRADALALIPATSTLALPDDLLDVIVLLRAIGKVDVGQILRRAAAEMVRQLEREPEISKMRGARCSR